MVKLPSLRKYQKEAIEEWLKHKRGIIQLPTGSGKTVIALSIWKELGYPKTLYIAPTNALIKDLMYKFQTKYKVPKNYLSDNVYKQRQITFATYMRVGTYNPELINDFDFIILDEAHHAGAEKFYKNALPLMKNKPVLGLSASPKTSSEYSDALLKKLPVIYKRTYKEKEMSKYRPETHLYITGVEFSKADRSLYQELDEQIREIRKKSGYKIKNVVDASRLISKNDQLAKLAGSFLKAYNQQKKLTQKAPEKVKAVINIIQKHKDEDRIMLFADTVDELVRVVEELNKIGIPAIALTSKTVSRKDIEIINEQFGTKYKVLGLVKMGEEGIDFPDLNVLIIMGSPKSERAIIQRVGRVLRFKEGKIAHIYFVFVKGTYEEDIARKYISKIHPDKVFYINTEDLLKETEEIKPIQSTNLMKEITILNKLLEMYSEADEKILKEMEELNKKYSPLQLYLNPKYQKLQRNHNTATRKIEMLRQTIDFLSGNISKEEYINNLSYINYSVADVLLEHIIPARVKETICRKLEEEKK